MGPLPVTPQGNQYILVVTDLFTKWVEAFLLVDTTATTLATILMNDIVCRYGVPTYLHSDQGANLCSAVVQKFCCLFGIHSTRTSAYHPKGNGQVEWFNHTVEAMLAKIIGDQQNWDLYLPKALLAYTFVHEVTGFTPYYLVFGHFPQLLNDVMTVSRNASDSSMNHTLTDHYTECATQSTGIIIAGYTSSANETAHSPQGSTRPLHTHWPPDDYILS